jgi:hypothetical protein
VEIIGAAVDKLFDELGNLGSGSPLGGQIANLLLRRDLASQEKPEETFWKGLGATDSLGEDILALGNLYIVSSDV